MPENQSTLSRCPECGSDDVLRVSVAYERETKTNTSDFAGIGASKGGLAVGGGISKSEQRSVFAERLKPPEYKKPEFGAGYTAVLVALGLVSIAFIPAAIATVPLGILIIHTRNKMLKEEVQIARANFDSATSDWRQSWVCRRCGHVDLSAEFRVASTSQP